VVKLTATKIGKLINRSPKYVYTLFHRKGISISDVDYEKIIDLIIQYRWRDWHTKSRNGKETKRSYCNGAVKGTAIQEYNKLFIKLYDECRERCHNVCADCGKSNFDNGEWVWLMIHHKDGNHGNMVAENLVLLCNDCHFKRHHESYYKT